MDGPPSPEKSVNPIGTIAILNCLCAEFLLELEINLPEPPVDGEIIGRFQNLRPFYGHTNVGDSKCLRQFST